MYSDSSPITIVSKDGTRCSHAYTAVIIASSAVAAAASACFGGLVMCAIVPSWTARSNRGLVSAACTSWTMTASGAAQLLSLRCLPAEMNPIPSNGWRSLVALGKERRQLPSPARRLTPTPRPHDLAT